MIKYISDEKNDFEVYILDIEMNNISGLDFAKIIREKNATALIIFVTSYEEYVFDVFEVITFDFIKKPISYEKFKLTINKVNNYLGIAKKNFAFSYRQNSYSIPYDKIKYLEKEGRKVWIKSNEGDKYQCNMTLEDIWKQLDKYMFASLCKSCIVNLAEVREIVGEYVILKDGDRLYASRDYRKEIKKKHLSFLKERL